METKQRIQKFLESKAFGVIGASNKREKFGNKVLRLYVRNSLKVYPVNPNEPIIEGIPAVTDVTQLPPEVKSISIITPPPITEKVVQAAITKGIENIWMQPGAESRAAIEACEANNINVIAGGPCILVEMGNS